MGMSAALMALFCERMLCSRYSCLRMLLHTALLCAGRLLPLPACLTLLPLPFILLQAREGRLMLSEILLPCALYALILDLELILPFPFVCSAALMIPLPLAAPWLRRLYAVFQQDKAPALLMMLLVYLQLVSFSLMALPFSTIPFALAAGCVVLTLCADMALLPLLQRLFLHAQEEEQLRNAREQRRQVRERKAAESAKKTDASKQNNKNTEIEKPLIKKNSRRLRRNSRLRNRLPFRLLTVRLKNSRRRQNKQDRLLKRKETVRSQKSQ